jgi:sigma-E factor negative regulatory protein RseC
MIEESAIVVQVSDDYAIVETEQRAACGSCKSAGSCSTSLLSGLFKRRHNQLRVLNPIHARPGERVVIGVHENALLKVSFSAYLLPLLCMLLMAIAVEQLTDRFLYRLGELPIIGGGLLGLVIGLLLFRRLSARRLLDPDYQAVILRPVMTQHIPLV